MKLDPRMRSRNVEDRRGRRGGRVVGAGGGLVVLVLLVASVFFPDAVPLLKILTGADGGPQQARYEEPAKPIDDKTNKFVSITLGYTEDFWSDAFRAGAFPRAGQSYRPARLVLFTGQVRSKCGAASAQSGPFYCPADGSIYIDPRFYDVMARQLKSPGDFAQAFVIAHEVAHHVQNVNGVLRQVHQAKLRGGDQLAANRLTVRVELQADCYSGVWARRTNEKHRILEQGDFEEALRAAYQVGDDIMMRMGGQRVDERKFTHGSAQQRSSWFRRGFDTGDLGACDTFSLRYNEL